LISFMRSDTMKQIIKFLLTGAVASTINYLVFFAAFRFLQFYYVLSSILGFFSGMFFSFLVNRFWTFKATGGDAKRQLLKYFIVNCIALLGNLVAISFFTEVLKVRPEISQIFAIFTAATINFSGLKLWAFKN